MYELSVRIKQTDIGCTFNCKQHFVVGISVKAPFYIMDATSHLFVESST